MEKLMVQECAVNISDANSSCFVNQRVQVWTKTGPWALQLLTGAANGSVCDLSFIYLLAEVRNGQTLNSIVCFRAMAVALLGKEEPIPISSNRH